MGSSQSSSAVAAVRHHVKSCATCRYWDSAGTDSGICALPSLTPHAGLYAKQGGPIITRSTFGCVQYAMIGHYGGAL